MNDIINSLTSPAWWFSVVVVGLILNIASAYLKPWGENIWGRYSSRRRVIQESLKRDYAEKVEFLRSNSQEQVFCALQEMRHRHRASLMLSLGTFFFLLPTAVLQLIPMPQELTKFFIASLFGFSSATIYSSMREIWRAIGTRRLLSEARNSKFEYY